MLKRRQNPNRFAVLSLARQASRDSPSTEKAGFAGAILGAGYRVELAGGGRYNAAAVCRDPIACTSWSRHRPQFFVYQPRQFDFQFPLRQEMKCEGLSIEGFCVAAGIREGRRDY